VVAGIDVYTITKLVHIVLAIVAIGFNASYGVWLARARREPEHLPHVLRGIKTLDDRFANPAYALLLVTGLLMVTVGNIPLTTFWIAAALVLWVTVVAIGLGLYTPMLRRQIRVLEGEGPDSPAYARLSTRATLVGILTTIPVALILILMVFKPARLF
jgi:uncharacterized membrane protein